MGLTVLVASDNSTVVSYINKQGGTRSIQLCRWTKKLLLVSGQPNSTPGTTHPWEIERPCRHSVMPYPDVRYRMVSTSIYLPSTDTGMGNPIIESVCKEVESQTSTICVPCSTSISHGSRCSVNELEGTLGIRMPTTCSVTMDAREGVTGPMQTDPHCPTLAPGDLFPTTLSWYNLHSGYPTFLGYYPSLEVRFIAIRPISSYTHGEYPGCPLHQRLFG